MGRNSRVTDPEPRDAYGLPETARELGLTFDPCRVRIRARDITLLGVLALLLLASCTPITSTRLPDSGWTAKVPGKDIQLAVFVYSRDASVSEQEALTVQRAIEETAAAKLGARGYSVLRELQSLKSEFAWFEGAGKPHSRNWIARAQGSTPTVKMHAAATWAKLREQRARSPAALYLIACITLARSRTFTEGFVPGIERTLKYGEPVVFISNYYEPSGAARGCQWGNVGFVLNPAFEIVGGLGVETSLQRAERGYGAHIELAAWGAQLGESMIDMIPAK